MSWPAFERNRERFAELERLLADPAVIGDRMRYAKLAKEHGALSKTLKPYLEYLKIDGDLQHAEAMVADPATDADMRAMAAEEVAELKPQRETLHTKLEDILLGSG